MKRTSISRQFKKDYPEYKEYADFMDILDPSEKALINQSKYVLKPFDEILRLFNFKFYMKASQGDIYTDDSFNWGGNADYFQRLFKAFLEWLEEDLFLRENGRGEYNNEELDKWDGLFEKLNKLPTEGTRIVFNIVEDVERKERDNYVKQIKGELAEKETLIEKFDLLYKLKMSKRFNHHDVLIEWIDDMLDLLKTGRYEELTASINYDVPGHLDTTEILLLIHFLSHKGLFPKLYNISKRKGQFFLSQLFNKPWTSFKNPGQNVEKITNKKLGIGQFDCRIDNLKNINRMLDGISDVTGIEDVIKKIKESIFELKEKKKEEIKKRKK